MKVSIQDFEARTAWTLDDRGACRGDVCYPLDSQTYVDGLVDVPLLAEQLGMPIVQDEKHELWSLGPHSGGRALVSAIAPSVILPDVHGNPFELESLKGQKVLLVAWASW